MVGGGGGAEELKFAVVFFAAFWFAAFLVSVELAVYVNTM